MVEIGGCVHKPYFLPFGGLYHLQAAFYFGLINNMLGSNLCSDHRYKHTGEPGMVNKVQIYWFHNNKKDSYKLTYSSKKLSRRNRLLVGYRGRNYSHIHCSLLEGIARTYNCCRI